MFDISQNWIEILHLEFEAGFGYRSGMNKMEQQRIQVSDGSYLGWIPWEKIKDDFDFELQFILKKEHKTEHGKRISNLTELWNKIVEYIFLCNLSR